MFLKTCYLKAPIHFDDLVPLREKYLEDVPLRDPPILEVVSEELESTQIYSTAESNTLRSRT
jgi:hypothetical protein